MKFPLLLLASLLLAGCIVVGGARSPSSPEFAQVRVGMTQDETLRLLGRPLETMRFPMSGQTSWDYRYFDQWGYLALFSVTFDPRGAVAGTFSQRLNDGGDFGGSK